MLGNSDLQRFRELLEAEGIVIDLPDRALRARLATLLLRFGLSSVEDLEILLTNDWTTRRAVTAELRRPSQQTAAAAEDKARGR